MHGAELDHLYGHAKFARVVGGPLANRMGALPLLAVLNVDGDESVGDFLVYDAKVGGRVAVRSVVAAVSQLHSHVGC